MTRPFLYDNFVQSQIGTNQQIGSSYNYNQNYTGSVQGPSQRYSKNAHSTQISTRGRMSLKQKINQLLGLCEEENNGIKSKFRQVIGAEKQILDLMKEQLQEQQMLAFNNYAKSDVQMFPADYHPSAAPQARNQYYQGYPKWNVNQSYQNQPNNYRNQERGNYNQYQPEHAYPVSTVPISSPKSPYKNISNVGARQNYQPQPQYNPQYQQHENYRPQSPSYPPQNNHIGVSQVFAPQQVSQAHQAQQQRPAHTYDGANIIKSKVIQVNDKNNRLPGFGYNQEIAQNRYDDAQVQQLQQEIARLKGICNNYESYLANAKSNNQSAQARYLLERLKEQGEDIRQNTIALLKNIPPSSPSNYGPRNTGSIGQAYNQNQSYNQNQGYNQPSSNNYRSSQPYHQSPAYNPNPQTYQRYPIDNNFPQQNNLQDDLRSQLQSLRLQCQQLHQQNDKIKQNKSKYTSRY